MLFFEDDITYCLSECDQEDRFRHAGNIADKCRPISYAYLKGTDFCPLTRASEKCEGTT
jgi:hypothetical protein